MVREKFKPTVSAEKNKEIQDLLDELKWTERLKANSLNKNHHEEGLRLSLIHI